MIQLDSVERAGLKKVVEEAEAAVRARNEVVAEVIRRHGGDVERHELAVVDIRSGLAELRERAPAAVVGPKIVPAGPGDVEKVVSGGKRAEARRP